MKPVVELADYKGLELHVDRTFDVSDVELEQELESFRQHHAILEEIENESVQLGDVANINFEGFKDGVAFPGGTSENYSLEIGSGSFIPGFEEQVIGMNIAEEKEIEVTFPENYQAENLAGAPVTFKVKVNKISRKQYPELNDDLVKNVTEFETVAELKQMIMNNLLTRKEAEAYNYKGELVMKKVIADATIEVPKSIIETELKNMITDLERRLQAQGATFEIFLQQRGLTKDELMTQFEAEAEKRVKTQFVLDEIAKAENVVVTEDDFEAEIQFLANMYKKQPEELKAHLKEHSNEDALKNELVLRKALDLLVKSTVYK